MGLIHPTALVDARAELDPSVSVGPYSVIGPQVRIGAGSRIASHVVIEGVEQPQDLTLAQQAGVEWLQGYAIAMPSAAAPAMSVLGPTSSQRSHV